MFKTRCELHLLFILSICILNEKKTCAVSHERSLLWAQTDQGAEGKSCIVGISGDPSEWVANRTGTTHYIVAPNKEWEITALGWDYSRKSLVWSETGNKKVQGLHLDGTNSLFTIFSGISSRVDGVATDWQAGNVYWVDSMYNWIVVAPFDRGRHLYKIVISTRLDKPVGLAVHPQQGLMFWSDWGSVPKIEKATLAGQNRHNLVVTGLSQPMGLVIDYKENRLYWTDMGEGSVNSVDLYGSDRRSHFKIPQAKFFGIALNQKYIFVTEQGQNQLYVFNREEKKHEVTFDLGHSVPSGVIMYDGDGQPRSAGFSGGCQEHHCGQLCVSGPGHRPQCLCAAGYRLLSDGRTCVDDGKYGTPQLIYTIGSALCRFPGNLPDMDLYNVSLDSQCFLTHRRDVLALTSNVHENAIYFAENRTKTISRVKLVEGEGPEVIVGGTDIVEGLAVDWITSNLYWTDSGHKAIAVCSTDGRYQTTLHNNNLDHPRGIAVDAVNRYLYWSDVSSTPRIERSGLDGSNRGIVIEFTSSEEAASPDHVAIDYLTERLYWSDSKRGRIDWQTLDGLQHGTTLSQPGYDVFGITVFQDYILWTERDKRNGLHAATKDGGVKLKGVIHPGIGTAYDVITYDQSVQPMGHGSCDRYNRCEQLCLPSIDADQARCACAMGFKMAEDGRSCRSDTIYDNFLLFTDTYQKQVYQMNIMTGDFNAVPLSGHDNPIGVNYDPVKRKIFWTDVSARVIKRANVNGSEEEIVRFLDSSSVPDGIAVDWVSRLLFYTDTGKKVIAAMSLDGVLHTTLIRSGLDQPRAIVLEPTKGYMFWTDWGVDSRIERASMDGSGRRLLVDTGKEAWPNGLAIDVNERKIYWCEARMNKIESVNYGGKNRRVLYQAAKAHFFGLSVLDGMVFYTDWTERSIMKLEKTDEGYMSSALGPAKFGRLNGVYAYRSTMLASGKTQNSCTANNGGCSDICLPIPRGRKCACPDNARLQSNGFQCSAFHHKNGGRRRPKQPSMTSPPSYVVTNTSTTKTPKPPWDKSEAEATTSTSFSNFVTFIQSVNSYSPTDKESKTANSQDDKEISPMTVTMAALREVTIETNARGDPATDSSRVTFPTNQITLRAGTNPTTSEKTPISEITGAPSGRRGSTNLQGEGTVSQGAVSGVFHLVTMATPVESQNGTVGQGNSSVLKPKGKLGFPVISLIGVSAGGVIVLVILVIAGICIFRKCAPTKRTRYGRRTAPRQPEISTVVNWHDTYEIPLKDAVTVPRDGAVANGIPYAHLDDSFYTGEADPGLTNLGYQSPRGSLISSYEEITQENDRQPTFSSFSNNNDLSQDNRA